MKNYLTLTRRAVMISTALCLAAPAMAGQLRPTQIVELFTSQGCSSCPPANALIGELAEDPDILALSYSVEYWDYLGWKDTFAKTHFSDRQRAYARSIGHGRVYTPQIVVNGSWDKARIRKSDLDAMPMDNAPMISLSADGMVTVDVKNDAPWDAVLVTYAPGEMEVAVDAGENRGRNLKLTNVVKSVDMLAESQSGSQEYYIDIPTGCDWAVIVQEPGQGKVLSAAVYKP